METSFKSTHFIREGNSLLADRNLAVGYNDYTIHEDSLKVILSIG